MATIQTYQSKLWTTGVAICSKMGVDPSGIGKSTRAVAKAILFLIAVLIKALVDKGYFTDVELNAAYQAAQDDAYPDEPM
jgi:hypothetical protein